MVSLINRRIGDYLLDVQIGAGAVGTVFRARHPSGRTAAIKVIHTELTRERSFADRFRRIAGAGSLAHPGAVPVEEVGESSGHFFIRMALLPNGSLRTLLERRAERLPLDRAVDYMRQVAEVLAFAHGRGVVHRDLKPENVLLGPPDATGAANTVAVGDWGLTQLIDTGVTVVGGHTPGSPRYLSPEQCKGTGADNRSDIYSLGVVLYEVATGLPPFRITTLADAFEKHVTQAPPPPRSIAPEIPAALESLILRCLAKAPDQRFQSADEVAMELARILTAVAPPRARGHVIIPREGGVPGVPVEHHAPPPASAPRKGDRQVVWRDQPGPEAPPVTSTPGTRPADAPVVSVPADPLVARLAEVAARAAAASTPAPNAPPSARGRVHLKANDIDLVDAGPTLPVGIGQQGDGPRAGKGAKPTSRSRRIQVVLDRTTLMLVPDQPQVLRVTLLNAGRTTEHFPLSVEGVPASWVQIPPDPPQLNPQERTTVPITIRVPRLAQNRAGPYTVTVQARSLLNPDEFATAVGEWTVLPFAAPSLTITPAKTTSWRRSTFTLHAHNGGNAPARFRFAGSDDEQALRYEFLDDPHVELANGESADVRVRVAGRMRWLGSNDTKPFVLRAEPVGTTGGSPPAALIAATAAGQLVRRALVPTWMPPLVGLAAIGTLFALRDRNTVALRVTPGRVQVEESKAERVLASVTNRKGELLPDQSVIWSTRDTTVAVVSDSGIVQGRKPGKTILVVSHGNVSESAEIEVVTGQVESMTVDPGKLTLGAGQSRTLRVTARDADGKRLQRTPRWESSDPSVVTIGGDGRIVAKDSGLATVTARIGEKFATATISVLAPPKPAAGEVAAGGGGADAGDCINYDPGSLRVHKLDGNDGFAVATDPANPVLTLDNESDARRGLTLARAYRSHCYLGRTSRRPNKNVYLIEYWLDPTGAPTSIDGEQCFPYNRSALRVIENGTQGFSLADPPRRLLLADTKADAEKIWEHAQQHSQMCFIGQGNRRPNQRDYIAQYWK